MVAPLPGCQGMLLSGMVAKSQYWAWRRDCLEVKNHRAGSCPSESGVFGAVISPRRDGSVVLMITYVRTVDKSHPVLF